MASTQRDRERFFSRDDESVVCRRKLHYYDGFEYHSDDIDPLPLQVFNLSERCIDQNNRSNPVFHKKKTRNDGYIGGGKFSLTRIIHESDVTPLPSDELCSTPDGGSAITFGGGLSSNAAPSRLSEVFVDDDDHVFHHFTDPYAEIGKYIFKARQDLRPDLAQFQGFRELIELRDVPKLLTEVKDALSHIVSRTFGLRRGAEAYLGYEFGYLPVVKSIRQYLQLYANINEKIQQLIRDDGRQVHRGRTYASENGAKDTGRGATKRSWKKTLYNELLADYAGLSPDTESCRTDYSVYTYDHIWFVGTFMYHLPPGVKDLAWAKKLANKLAGFTPTPADLYDLVPWSWLLDWFTNVGEVVHYLFPSQVSETGAFTDFYGMFHRHTEVKYRNSFRLYQYGTSDPVPIGLHASLRFDQKFRSTAGPFDHSGLSVMTDDFEQLSDFQKSIIGALGVTRFPRLAR